MKRLSDIGEKGSPKWVARSLDKAFDSAENRLADFFRGFPLLSLALPLALFVILVAGLLLALRAPGGGGGAAAEFLAEIRNTRQFRFAFVEWPAVVLGPLAVGTLALAVRRPLPEWAHQAALALSVGALSLAMIQLDSEAGLLTFLFTFGGVLLFHWLLGQLVPARFARRKILFSLAALLLVEVYLEKFRFEPEQVTWVFKAFRVFLLSSLIYVSSDRNGSSSLFFSSSQILNALPCVPLSDPEPGAYATRARGLLHLVLGFLFGWAAIILRMRHFPGESWSASWQGIAFNYLYYFFITYAWFSLPVGTQEWMGQKLPRFFEHPLLATSPQQRWREWSIYYYKWLNAFIFIPLRLKTGWLYLPMFLVFFVSAYIHMSHRLFRAIYELLTQGFCTHAHDRNGLIFWFANFVAVAAAMRFTWLWPSEKRMAGWLGVLGMFALYSWIYRFIS